MEEEIKYPRFIQNKPCGIDKYEGGSQKRLAKAISEHIISTDNLNDKETISRIIGLEGAWGSGKSNVVKLLGKELDNKYFLFEYDAWGNQEDLQRRSFLEILTSTLIKEGHLSGKTKIRIKGGEEKDVTWDEKLKFLLARKTETISEKYPRISNGIAVVSLAILLTPIFTFIADTLIDPQVWWSKLMSILISILPLVSTVIIWLFARKKNENYNKLSHILTIYNDKVEKDICYETISEDEPTVVEFKAWMQSISDYIKEDNQNRKKIIVVFDNMDRLPAEKVKQLWSSIHTFFADGGFQNVWVIIPFDEKHLSYAFNGEDNESNREITGHFISKTFPVVYRVAPPVITDYKKMFSSLLTEAFGHTEIRKQGTVNRIYRLVNPHATVREMISFLNQLVALKSVWKEKIDMLHLAIFILTKENLLKDPVPSILSGEYLGEISKIVSNNETIQKNMSALVYGIDINDAEQIPIRKYIESCLNRESGYDINKYATTNKHFMTIFEDFVQDANVESIDKIIECYAELKTEEFDEQYEQTFIDLWNHLTDIKLKHHPLQKQEFESVFKPLIIYSDDEHKPKIVKYLCEQFQRFNDFKGEKYYNAISKLEDTLSDNEIDIPLVLDDLEKSPEIFIEYVEKASDDYPKYKLKVKPTELDSYYTKLLQEDKLSHIEILSIIKEDDNYEFPNLLDAIEESISSNKITEKNVEQIYSAYKILIDDKPFKIQLNTGHAQNLLNTLTQQVNNGVYPNEYFDVVAINISNGINVSVNFDDKQIEKIAECIEYYKTFGDLLIDCVSWNVPVLNQVLSKLTKKEKSISRLNIVNTLPLFDSIKNKIQVDEKELLERLNGWNSYAVKNINKSNIQTVIPNATFFQYSIITKNELTDHLNKAAIEALADISDDTLYQQRPNINDYYWFTVIKNLIDSEFIKTLPDNLTEFGKRILKDVANGTQAIPVPELFQKIVDKLDKRKTGSTIKDIRDDFFATRIITVQQFKYFESWFENQGDFAGVHAGSVVRRIIRTVINDSSCLNLILSKSDFYSQVINNAGDDAIDLKNDIANKLKSSTDKKLQDFAAIIGIEIEKTESKK